MHCTHKHVLLGETQAGEHISILNSIAAAIAALAEVNRIVSYTTYP